MTNRLKEVHSIHGYIVQRANLLQSMLSVTKLFFPDVSEVICAVCSW